MQRRSISREMKIVALSALLSGSVAMTSISYPVHAQKTGSTETTSTMEQTFKQYQEKALEFEHKGDKKQALETIKAAQTLMKQAPQFSDQVSQLRVRLAELQLQNKLEPESFATTNKLLQDAPSITSGANPDGDLWLEIGYLKDLLFKYGQDRDFETAYDLAHKLCKNFKQIRCKPRDTLQPLCETQIRHKSWVPLESSAKELLAISDNPLTKMTSLAMLQLSFSKQGKIKDAAVAQTQLNRLDPKTSGNERVWHRDMAGVQKSILNFDGALSEISLALALDDKLSSDQKITQLATDLGIKAEIETLSGKYEAAIKDARLADKLWGECNPSIWRSRESQVLAKYHADSLSALEQALRKMHKSAEADEVRSRRRQIQYIR